jgi:hypothetical protein
VKAKADEEQKSAILATFGKHSKPKGGFLCDRAVLVEDISMEDMKPLPMGDENGMIHRDSLLMWLFVDPSNIHLGIPLSQGMFGKALKARTSQLLALAESSPRSVTLDQVWKNGRAWPSPEGAAATDEAIWHQCLINLGARAPPVACNANHFLKVIEADFDANKVIFPNKALRDAYPKPLPPLTPVWELTVRDGNLKHFPVPGSMGDGWKASREGRGTALLKRIEDQTVREEVRQLWLAGLAQNSFGLRSDLHSDPTTLDVVLDPWPRNAADVIKKDQYIGGQQKKNESLMTREFQFEQEQLLTDPSLIEEHRHLRNHMHADDDTFNVAEQPWPMVADGFIKKDVCTVEQIEVHQRRFWRGPLSQAQLEVRRADLQTKLSRLPARLSESWTGTSPRFFEEIYHVMEKEAALAEALVRKANDKIRKARDYDEAAELGAKFVAWPAPGTRRWPEPSAAWTQHCMRFAKGQEMRSAGKLEAPKYEQLCEIKQAEHQKAVSESQWLRLVHKLSVSTTSSSSGMDSESSESDWEALSKCSADSDWEVSSEMESDASDDTDEADEIACWCDVAPEAEEAADPPGTTGELNISHSATEKLALASYISWG